METVIFWSISLAFAFAFCILGMFIIFLNIPKEDIFKYYRYSRYTLGIGFFSLAVYCCIHPLLLNTSEFTNLCFTLLISLLVSWLTYSAFLFVIYAEGFKRKRFFLDGIIPISLMLVCALIGLKYPHFQEINSVLFGIIFGAKCLWMGYTCIKEYRKCTKDLENYYENTPDIKWMYSLILVSIALSACTVVAFYVKPFENIYYLLLLGVYVYMTFKMVNYLPQKISAVRKESVEYKEEKKDEAKKNNRDLKAKLEASVNRWIEEKNFIRPDLNIRDVAQEIGTNHNYLSKYLNSILGMTFSVWLHTLKIEESKALLTGQEKMSVEEVGRKVGILEIYNFSRWFKNITGMTPQQYRKANK